MRGLLLAAGFVISGSALAGGFYAGGQVGGNSTSAEIDHTGELYTGDMGKSDATGGVYAGYSMHMDGFNIGIELDYSFVELKSKLTVEGVADINFKFQESYGASFIAGMPMTEKLDIYGRVGYARSSMKSDTGFYDQDSIDFVYNDKSKNLDGVVFGLGSSYKIEENLSLRMDYRFVNYGKVKFEDIPNSQELEVKVAEQIFTVGIHYHF
ncbi:hypothetical protein CI610_01493 [invertebrate metagenome]|uniref:Outer membrane protein OmpA-like transmembrane domain-containing protein n=1 Tax=invertebrate metagenome TaxID=1711999 RepID=A0A2H9T8K1_9ZZZZ